MNEKVCPKCGRKMLLSETGDMFPTHPPMFEREWFCGCGHREDAEPSRNALTIEARLDAWRRLNGIGAET